jgi:hypothetical protein
MGLDMYLCASALADAPNFPLGHTAEWNKDTNPAARELADVLGLPKDNAGVGNYGSVQIDAEPDGRRKITVHAGYWRKANHIHKWFVDNVQHGVDECQEAPVTLDQLRQLKSDCLQVLGRSELVPGKINNGQILTKEGWSNVVEDGNVIAEPAVAQEILPTASGFFFGGTDYDEWYYRDVEHTVTVIDACLAAADANDTITFYYQSSW